MFDFADLRPLGLFFLLFVSLAVSGCSPTILGGYEVKGNVVVYHSKIGSYGTRNKKIVEEADPESFEIMDRYYGRDRKAAYYRGNRIEGSDGPSFQLLDFPYSRDKNHIYYYWAEMSDSPDDFRILFKVRLNKQSIIFSSDGAFVYKTNEKFFPDSVDPATFERIGETNYFRDKINVYTFWGIVSEADSASFKVIERFKGKFASDRANTYYQGELVDGVDRDSHQIIDEVHHRDKTKIYFGSTVISFNPDNFRVISEAFSVDSNSVFWQGIRISEDPANFRAFPSFTKESYGKDREKAFWCRFEIEDADVETFVGLNHNYAKDRNKVYFGYDSNSGQKVVVGADPKTFALVKGKIGVDARDRNGEYFFGFILSKGRRTD